MNFAFYISGKGTRLQKFLEYNSKLSKNIKVVLSDDPNNLYLKDYVEGMGIKYLLYSFGDLKISKVEKNEYLSNIILDELKKNKVDYCFSFGNHILKGKLLEEYKNKLINFHPAILPSYPGKYSIDQAVNDNAFVIGNTAHFIDEGLDSGPIIMNSVQNIDVFYEKGYEAILDNQVYMLEKLISLLEQNRIKIEKNKVKIIGANYSNVSFFPEI